MAPWSCFRDIFGEGAEHEGLGLLPTSEGYPDPSRDTLAAIGELSRAVESNPDAFEIYLALGNLFRSQGELERAVHLRGNLISKPGLENHLKARAFYELGRDYKRAGFMDRALEALGKAEKLADTDPIIRFELARLYAETGEMRRAADLYGELGHSLAQAHYLVRLAGERFSREDEQGGRELLDKALEVYPGAVEAWTELLLLDLQTASGEDIAERLRAALGEVSVDLRFVLLEMLLRFLDDGVGAPLDQRAAEHLLDVLREREPAALMEYYSGLISLRCGIRDEGLDRLERAVVLQPDFWPARLELLSLTLPEQGVGPVLREQLDFFLSTARAVKRYVCRVCGLRNPGVFYVCPRCQSWHSIGFRMRLSE
ncbi:tetratricopeptide repeat protein [Desulfohalovibrio reitneri]|uniref:tetratricopeptide repeat protein n=1 Tax=Desulfohalovibrio reitneri TaxID=1307759 RepID=UPI0004A6DA63|nr:tetratricopeptide repeat protein [Desulfohalovibrio reitneri]